MPGEIKGKYNPLAFEQKIYWHWFENKYFFAKIDKSKIPFSMVIPPPNVTGYLHIGHALNNILQDVIIRYKRMSGYNTTWIPGTDHAGIATQNVVEKTLEEKNINRFQLGREKFVEEVWRWKEKYGSRIITQLKLLGCSCDWDRERFTLDSWYCKAVTREFVTLYRNGLIYRGNYMVNWCPRCQTAISDIEVEHIEKEGNLWDIKYPLIDKKTGKPSDDEYIVVSTTRPETMLGDTAVAVNPEDNRFKKYKGRSVYLPLMERKIPLIDDAFVDMEFGSGAVKVTPAHDPDDFEIGKRHGLEEINIFNKDASLNFNAGKYDGLDRNTARQKVLHDLDKQGYLAGKNIHRSSIGICSRCSTVIEPRISMQWFVSMKELTGPATAAVKEGRVKIIPKKWEKIYFNWMENIRDWCISRQLWWGHRIPVWYCKDCNEMIVSEKTALRCPKCGGSNLEQDQDVLDTWFSSCLWPFAVFGWPEETEDLEHFFPTAVLVTAHDIIFFWVARMIMMSLYFKKDVPFREVFINPLVNDAFGQKMSKSRGNVVDPADIIKKNGTDVLRFTLTSLTTPGRNLILGDEKIEGVRNFANKLWNASKFVISNLSESRNIDNINIDHLSLGLWDRWILSRLNRVVKGVEKNLRKYNFSFASKLLNNFLWNDYCDWYIESAKVRIYFPKDNDDKKNALFILWYVLERYLKLLHPFMPFITEQIWQNIPHKGKSIMVESFPEFEPARVNKDIEDKIKILFDVIGEIRKIRSELKISPASRVKVNLLVGEDSCKDVLEKNREYICSLAKTSEVEFKDCTSQKGYIKTTIGNIDIFIYILDVIDMELEIKRIKDQIKRVDLDIEKSKKKISNPDFTSKAPEEIIQKEKDKLYQADRIWKVLNDQLARMESTGK
ncbi:MAG: valine--tRNA ligase [Actinobacteria bacterium]|nr:valine--tRNA ligase [Actinomycetota bacterium]